MKYTFAILFLLLGGTVFGQKYSKCYVYQYFWTDSINKKIVLEREFNEEKRVISEKYSNYQLYYTSIPKNYKKRYSYKDSLLKTEELDNGRDLKITTKYFYNSKRQNIFQKIECSILSNPRVFLERRTKRYHRKIYLKYDRKGRVIFQKMNKAIPNADASFCKKICVYDDSDRIHIEYEFDRDFDSFCVNSFKYFNGGYRVVRLFNPFDRSEIDTFIYQMDAFKNVIQEVIETQSMHYRIVYYYSNGRLIKEEVFDALKYNIPITEYLRLTREYVYE